jgi:hypothetical protein
MTANRKRCFIHMSKAWYADAVMRTGFADEVALEMYEVDASGERHHRYEFRAQWHQFDRPTLRIGVFEDAFDALTDFADLFRCLVEIEPKSRNMSPEAFCALLESLGIEDATPHTNPEYAPAPVCPTCHRMMEA